MGRPGYLTAVVPDSAAMRPAGLFGLDQQRVGDVTVVSVHGDADLHSAPELRERLARIVDSGEQALVVDLSEVTFVDSMALGVLLRTMKRMGARGGRLRLVVTRPETRRIFEITLLDRVLAIDATREAALANVRHAADVA